MHSLRELADLAQHEFAALEDEGVAAGRFRRRFRTIVDGKRSDAWKLRALDELYDAMAAAAAAAEVSEEPSALPAIRKLRPVSRPKRPKPPSDATYTDRLRGAWLGRVAGCILGKPVEGWPREQIRIMLEAVGEYPLRRPYFPRFSVARAPRGFARWKPFAAHRRLWNENPCLRGNIVRAVNDDDTNYTVLGLVMIERHGHDLSTNYIGRMWHETLPYNHVCTAEHVAYANLIRGIEPPRTATYRNPFRQWIGAQIRCDAFGYCANGDPERAATWAHADAALSHTRNGIYGEMFFAALIAACTAMDRFDDALDAALAEIPPGSRFAETVRWIRALRNEERDWEAARDRIEERYGHLHVVHTINNAAVVLLGLLWGDDDFHKTVSRAVIAGWDTDCNGATAGSVFGALHGAGAIPAGYAKPLHDTLATSLAGFSEGSILGYAERSLRAARSAARRMRRARSKGQ